MKLRITPEAAQDMEDIKKYISEKLYNPNAATNTLIKIIKTCNNLLDFPIMGASLTGVTGIVTDFRYLICGSYLIFYKQDSAFISIYRILYGKQDYMKTLFGILPENETD
jgi:addiction module RelE/StbE family toxin